MTEPRPEPSCRIFGQRPQVVLRIAGVVSSITMISLLVAFNIPPSLSPSITLDIFCILFSCLLCCSEFRFLRVCRAASNWAVKWLFFVATYIGRGFFYFISGLLVSDPQDLDSGENIGRFIIGIIYIVVGVANCVAFCACHKHLAADDPPPEVLVGRPPDASAATSVKIISSEGTGQPLQTTFIPPTIPAAAATTAPSALPGPESSGGAGDEPNANPFAAAVPKRPANTRPSYPFAVDVPSRAAGGVKAAAAEEDDFERNVRMAGTAVDFARANPEAARAVYGVGKSAATKENAQRVGKVAGMFMK
eukprot:TRINITY_DN45259_c0_g1_i1.p2 TRINITY_DN45259_c0_g1~~TRINITY_DN45259_c0_g1_i1.p2  ORF type:complete len:306 (-),score=29.90 TRINITY_DN45259_c0_g1_i1:531-1448(-)